jgi:peroxiredoxin Q/BCP
MMLQVGEMAPQFELQADDGTTVSLAALRGSRVVVFFYPKANTSGCTTQACGFRDNLPVIEAAGATVLGISPDEPSALTKWQAKEQFGYKLLSDPDHAVAEAYGVWGEKSMYGRTYMGIIRSHFVIDADGRLEDVQLKVSPKNSVERALKHVQAA